MADNYRPLSFLPSIKCSSCGVDIEIAQLADHVCATTTSKNPEPTLPKLDRAATFGGSAFNNTSSGQTRPVRMPPPPRIDPSAANKPFQPQNQPTPLSNYSSKGYSPLSPGGGRLPFKMNRSATSPMPRPFSPPSPDLPSNMDCAFPPFPTSGSATPNGTRPKTRERPEPAYTHRYAEPDPLYAPVSPRTNGGESVLRRMDTIAPGPFDGRGSDSRPSTSNGRAPGQREPEFGHRRTATQGSISSNGRPSAQRSSLASNRSRSSTFSNGSVGLPARPKPGMSGMAAMPPPPRPPRAEGIDAFLDRLQKETMEPFQISQDSRSRTFPIRKESRDATGPPPRPRRPSESNSVPRRPTDVDSFNSVPRPNNMFPTRSTSRGGSKSGIRPDEAPPMPPIPDYGKDLPPKPLHTPSDSGLSDDSVSSSGFRSAASSRSSPPASEGGHSRKPSKTGRTDILGGESIPRSTSPEPIIEPRVPPRLENHSGPVGYNRGNAPEPLLQPPSMPFSDAPESPLDPAIQRGLLHQKRPSESQGFSSALPSSVPKSPPRQRFDSELRGQVNRRPTTTSKGKCRGCSEPIIGKSIKDSSGRLTGRYHKQCFVCRTCRAPFPTADFYVFENFPYCEQHYHQFNGSLCRSCNRGIEGQYLETDQCQKFHPRCFTCLTCRIVLRDDYYEVGGKVYCDRHAYHAAQQNTFLGPGGNKSRNLQKRTTRLMMMM
ncbi:hypothetical protein K469DRAFT_624773 [Zopfia rhizophila CBS 207.26]|uniref:LIM zinc-binding domain-containing protein n=1 Tax=Zopfia rhizophila CBS 207.26 TaxID=1314779 RepID=A0A6A6EGJ2_9PEZI|nr:hypothetical protein K469DRAFT_624773 [Zopfia rhizophila CBS 207.26]